MGLELEQLINQNCYFPGDAVLLNRGSHSATIRYAGQSQPVVEIEDSEVWKIPNEARAGLYELQVGSEITPFAVLRQEVAITGVHFNQAVYAPGQPLTCRVTLRNATPRTIRGLRLEFAEAHYPWIAPEPGHELPTPTVISDGITLRPNEEITVQAANPHPATSCDIPSAHPFVAMVWNQSRTKLLHLAITPPVFIRPTKGTAAKAYPFHQTFPNLNAVDTTRYRQFATTGDATVPANDLPKSILIVCAHQDDEIAHAGIIQAAAQNNIPLHVVYLTCGDAGGPERYFQRTCGPAEALEFGTVRLEESKAALAHLGLDPSNVRFLGLPDGALEQIWHYHPYAEHPYWSILLGTAHSPFAGAYLPNLPYAKESVIEALKEIIQELQPEVIYTGHPDERHADHRTANWFVVAALRELKATDTIVRVDQVYGPRRHHTAPYAYRPHTFRISEEAALRIQEATWFYQSQGGNQGRGNILPASELPRVEQHWEILDWMEHAGWNELKAKASEAA